MAIKDEQHKLTPLPLGIAHELVEGARVIPKVSLKLGGSLGGLFAFSRMWLRLLRNFYFHDFLRFVRVLVNVWVTTRTLMHK